MKRFWAFLDLIRVKQWYKNIVFFLGFIFGHQLFIHDQLISSLIGFGILCQITSCIYIRNDIIDMNLDKEHPKKKTRPLPSGLITVREAYTLFFVLLSTGLIFAFVVNFWFGVLMVLLVINTEIYSRKGKDVIILDVFMIGINFIIRAIAGIAVIKAQISPWIILGVFFVALLLGFIKRKNEMVIMEGEIKNNRKVLDAYTMNSLNSSILISAMMIITTYSLYSIFGSYEDGRLIITMPFVAFIILRQLYLASTNHDSIQSNEFYKDKVTAISFVIFSALVMLLLYAVPEDTFKIL